MCDNVKNSGVGLKLMNRKSLDFSEEMDKMRKIMAKTCNITYKKSYEFSIKNGIFSLPMRNSRLR